MSSTFDEKVSRIEQTLSSLFLEEDVPWNALYQAASYSLFSGGKRLRPLITLTVTEALNGDIEAALVPACAIEAVHTYSLIHDDLPAMDNDDFRRGKPSLHRATNEGLAILTGDYLLTRAFDLISHAPLLTSGQKLDLIQILSHTGGACGMIGGQVIDIDDQKHPIEKVHELKTAALISGAAEFGSVIANHLHRDAIRAFGKNLGLAYQMIDDLIDGEAGRESGKRSCLESLSRDQARDRADNYLKQALECLEGIQNKEPFYALADRLVHRKV